MSDDQSGLCKAVERVSRLRAEMIKEISRREKDLLLLRGKLSGVEMVIAECLDDEE